MNTKNRTTYDRSGVGLRLKSCRLRQGWSRCYVAERIGIVEKYYADIERGTCGMSIETMMGLAELYRLTLDEIIFGFEKKQESRESEMEEQLQNLSPQARERCAELVCLFIKGIREKV